GTGAKTEPATVTRRGLFPWNSMHARRSNSHPIFSDVFWYDSPLKV
ncbi:unnamed protein product, partial [marine sediment metagenome]